ncbi:MAG: ABC transporter ATP-binding protein [Bulleidia sp.]
MTSIQLEGISKKYDNGFAAVKNLNLDIQGKQFVILVGPSGCGKSTTLRMIAGLEEITEGELRIDGVRMNDVPPQDRNIAMVFQNYALYPHMTVFQNIAYSLKIKHVPKKEIEERVHQTAKTLDLEELLDRKPNQLSGGQKQRVAMGRAIIRNPKVFLMDEPLSNLDAKLRTQMRVEIASLYNRLDTTFIYVTHDQTEAMTLGTMIVVMNHGDVQQIADPYHMFHTPANQFVAGFIGNPSMNFTDVQVVAEEGDIILTSRSGGRLKVTSERAELIRKAGLTGKTAVLGVRPEHVTPCIGNEDSFYEGTVNVYEMLGYTAIVHTITEDGTIVSSVDEDRTFQSGDHVRLHVNADHIHVFDKDTGITVCN